MLHRVFIAINLDNNLKNKILQYQEDFSHIPAKWVSKENIHITLSFLGNLDDTQLMETISIVEGVVGNYDSIILRIKEIGFGPKGKMPPRLIWLTLDQNDILNRLQQELEDNIYSLDSYRFKSKEDRNFTPHITLARIKSFEARKLNLQNFDFKKELDINFEATTIDVIESGLTKSGPEYTILRSIEL